MKESSPQLHESSKAESVKGSGSGLRGYDGSLVAALEFSNREV